MSAYVLPLAIIAGLILLNAMFVAAEFSIVAASRARLAQIAEGGSRAAQYLFRLTSDPERRNVYLATAQIGITMASLGLGMYGENVVAGWLIGPLEHLGGLAEPLAHTIAVVVAVGLLTYLHIVLGELVPLSMALQNADSISIRLSGIMRLLTRLLQPLVVGLNNFGNFIIRLMGIPPADAHARLFSAQELEYLVEESAGLGLMDAEERLYIENIFDLRERNVGRVMTPRNHIVGIAATASESEVLRTACEGRHSRYPVYQGSLDHIVGVLHVKTLARQQARTAGGQEFSLQKLVRPVMYVPESLPLDQMLLRFRRQRHPIAVVVDEFGGTAGLVTLEDVVEEVVGEILDEFDEELPPLEEIEPGLVRVRGNLLIDELNQLCDLNLSHPETDTIGGLVMALLGRVAQPGDVFEHEGVRFEVEAVEGLAVQTVLVHLPGEVDAPH